MWLLLGMFSGTRPLFEREPDPAAFPERGAAQLNRTIAALLSKETLPAYYHASARETQRQHGGKWMTYDYAAQIGDPAALSPLLLKLSETIENSGGEIFQTYSQPEERRTTLVIGIGTLITHTIVISWPEIAPVAQEPQPFRAAIIIDDLGTSLPMVERLLALNQQFTFSILPHQKASADIAELLHARQQQVLLHLPMEPQDYPSISPGKGAILSRMSADQIQRQIQEDLATVPYASGVNNHMGSRLTTQAGMMQAVLKELQQRQLFFVDSRTTDATIAFQLAQQIGVKSGERKIFLDANPGKEFAKEQMRKLAELAEQGGPAIAIGHPKEATLTALEETLPEFQRRNIKIVSVSELLQ
ncbi:hypothetical protein U14_03756 [Candidatus Moduliflexus flocculans]|uniref:Divergent polysaccharide deacetylase family protein n=1 Tax=Candidatus Moduliflexus flocculans TaxID=1499966 RepID=A0A081BQ39_9BACT|nr:hypothetical protein U14_03756 [Candidatus Moduliflexus flocculans]